MTHVDGAILPYKSIAIIQGLQRKVLETFFTITKNDPRNGFSVCAYVYIFEWMV